MNLQRVKKTAEKLEAQISECIEVRELKKRDNSERWHKSKTGREFRDEQRILGELLDAVNNFNTVINQPFEEEE